MYTPNEIALETFIKNVYSCFDYFGQDGADYVSDSTWTYSNSMSNNLEGRSHNVNITS